MKKITHTLLLLLFGIALFAFYSCSKDRDVHANSTISQAVNKTNVLEKYKLNQITRVEYLQMGKAEKEEFEDLYKQAYGDGGTCDCTSSGDPACSCDITCNPGTKPNCQCSNNGCTCSCQLYGYFAINMVYDITKNDNETVTLISHTFTDVLSNYLDSDFVNTTEVGNVFNEIEEMGDGEIILSDTDYQLLESKMQSFVGHYSIDELFSVEFLF